MRRGALRLLLQVAGASLAPILAAGCGAPTTALDIDGGGADGGTSIASDAAPLPDLAPRDLAADGAVDDGGDAGGITMDLGDPLDGGPPPPADAGVGSALRVLLVAPKTASPRQLRAALPGALRAAGYEGSVEVDFIETSDLLTLASAPGRRAAWDEALARPISHAILLDRRVLMPHESPIHFAGVDALARSLRHTGARVLLASHDASENEAADEAFYRVALGTGLGALPVAQVRRMAQLERGEDGFAILATLTAALTDRDPALAGYVPPGDRPRAMGEYDRRRARSGPRRSQ